MGTWLRRSLIVLAAGAVAGLPAPAAAQPAGAFDMGACLRGYRVAFESNPDLNVGTPSPTLTLADPGSLVYDSVDCAQQMAVNTFKPVGMTMWSVLAIIIVVWTGVQMALSGGIDMGSLIATFLSLAVPLMILDGYAPGGSYVWGDLAFTSIFVNMAQWASGLLLADAFANFVAELGNMWEWLSGSMNQADDISSGADEGHWLSALIRIGTLLVSAAVAIFAGWLVGALTLGTLLFVVLPPILLYCQYLWGLVTMLVAILLGPIFVPFLLVPQLSFLFWGWIKSLLGGMVHSIVAAGLFVVISNLMLLPMRSLIEYSASPGEPGVIAVLIFAVTRVFLYIPIVILAYMVAMRVSEITAMVLGGGVPTAGLAGIVGGMTVRGASKG